MPPQQTEARSGNGVILGQVIDAGSGRAVPGAIVRLVGGTDRPIPVAPGSPPGPPTVITNRDGRFVFRNLPAGSYNAIVTISGYTNGTFGRLRLDGPGRPILLAENERVVDATIRLWKQAAITGTVTDESGEPLIGVAVTALRRTTVGGRRRLVGSARVSTDDRGIFRLAGLTPGDYLVAVPMTVTSMPVAAADEYMQAMYSGTNTHSKLMSQRAESGAPETFTGSGLVLGDQQISVEQSFGPFGQSGGATGSIVDGRFFALPTTFHGGVAASAQATVISLQSGEARTGVDIRLRSVATSRVSGVITGPEGPVPNLGVRLVAPEIEEAGAVNGFETALTMTDATGRFTFPGVPSGSYVLRAYRVPRPSFTQSPIENLSIVGGVASVPPMASTPPEAVATLWAQSVVTVGGDDVTDLAVSLRPGLRVSGRVEFQGTQSLPHPLPQITVTLQPADGRSMGQASIPPGRLEAGGSFTTSGYPSGQYWVNVAAAGLPVSPAWTVKSIQAGGVNLIERPLELESADISGLTITFTDRASELSGTVTGATGPNDDATIVVFPADYQAWLTSGRSPRRTVTATADRKGAYQLRLPPAGDYIVAAVLNERLGDLDLAEYAVLARTGTRISVTEGEKKTLALAARSIR